MKKRHVITIVVLVIILIGLGIVLPKKNPAAQPTSVSTPQASVQIIFPTKADQLAIGQTYSLKWQGGQNPIDIFLVDDATKSVGVSVSLVDRIYHIPNTGSYDYTVPKYLKPGFYQFEIGDSTSDEFQVVAK